MKQVVLCMIALGVSTSAFASACFQGGTLSSYETAGSCTFTGNGQTYTLQDFTFLAVSVLTGGGTANDFTLTESVGANGPSVVITPNADLNISTVLLATETFLLGFDITSNDATIGFSDVDLNEQSTLSAAPGLTGLNIAGGIATGIIAEEDCFGGALPLPGNINILSLGNGGLACLNGGPSIGASVALSPGVNVNATVAIPLNTQFTNSVDVLKEINLTATGNILGVSTASISSITQAFTTESGNAAVPEPASFFIGGCGLIGLALVGRRRVKGGAKI